MILRAEAEMVKGTQFLQTPVEISPSSVSQVGNPKSLDLNVLSINLYFVYNTVHISSMFYPRTPTHFTSSTKASDFSFELGIGIL